MRELELPDFTILTSDQKDDLIRLSFVQIRILTARVSELEEKTRSLRRLSGAKRGGQVGHQGTTLKRVQEPDEVIEHAL